MVTQWCQLSGCSYRTQDHTSEIVNLLMRIHQMGHEVDRRKIQLSANKTCGLCNLSRRGTITCTGSGVKSVLASTDSGVSIRQETVGVKDTSLKQEDTSCAESKRTDGNSAVESSAVPDLSFLNRLGSGAGSGNNDQRKIRYNFGCIYTSANQHGHYYDPHNSNYKHAEGRIMCPREATPGVSLASSLSGAERSLGLGFGFTLL